MTDFGYYNADCMDVMRELPDKSIDLANVDPPYVDGGVHGQAENDSGNGSISTGIPRGGWHGKQAYHLGTPKRPESTELVELGRRSSEKNHSVGHCAETGIFRGAVSCLTESDYMGWQLLLTAAMQMFSDMAKDKRAGEVLDGDVRVRMDKHQRQC